MAKEKVLASAMEAVSRYHSTKSKSILTEVNRALFSYVVVLPSTTREDFLLLLYFEVLLPYKQV